MFNWFSRKSPDAKTPIAVYPEETGKYGLEDIELLREIELVFVIDSTSSMGRYIGEVQKKLRDFSARLSKSDLHPKVSYGIVAYRDHPPQDSSYVTRLFPFSKDIRKVQSNIDSVSAQGGGDTPEAVVDGLNDAVSEMSWSRPAHKVILLVGDAPPHGVGAPGDGFGEGCPCGMVIEKVVGSAKAKGIVIHSVGVGPYEAMIRSFTKIAELTGGEFVPLDKVDSLINNILSLLDREFAEVVSEIDIYKGISSGETISEIAAKSKKSSSAISESVEKLRVKGFAIDATDINRLKNIADKRSTKTDKVNKYGIKVISDTKEEIIAPTEEKKASPAKKASRIKIVNE